MVVGGGNLRPYRLRQDPAQGILVQREGFNSQEARKTCFLESFIKTSLSFGERDIV
jgi:hypothetical protein